MTFYDKITENALPTLEVNLAKTKGNAEER